MEITTTEPKVIPFGKYNGTPIDEVIARDPRYIQWLMQQPWFREKYVTLVQNITNIHQGPSDETPEHNKMQRLFLDDAMCFAAIELAQEKPFDMDLSDIGRLVEEDRFNRTSGFKLYDTYRATMNIEKVFEPVDVWIKSHDIGIELKPTIGDDYPAVIRQVQSMQRRIAGLTYGNRAKAAVVFREFNAEGVTLDEARQMFGHSNIALIALADIQALAKDFQAGGPRDVVANNAQRKTIVDSYLAVARAKWQAKKDADDKEREEAKRERERDAGWAKCSDTDISF